MMHNSRKKAWARPSGEIKGELLIYCSSGLFFGAEMRGGCLSVLVLTYINIIPRSAKAQAEWRKKDGYTRSLTVEKITL